MSRLPPEAVVDALCVGKQGLWLVGAWTPDDRQALASHSLDRLKNPVDGHALADAGVADEVFARSGGREGEEVGVGDVSHVGELPHG